MATKIQVRRDTSSNWGILNVVLSAGEIGFETNTNKFKIGNGSSAWSALPYFSEAQDLSAYLTTASASTSYLTQTSASTTYLTQASASTTYLTQASGSTNYATKVDPTFSGSVQLGTAATLIFEGSIDNAFDTTLTVTNPTANRTITFPNATGTVALTSDLSSYVTLSGTQTLSNKTINDSTINSLENFSGFNTKLGTSAVGNNFYISNNTGIGYQALSSLTSEVIDEQVVAAFSNTAVGHQAGDSITLGTNNIVLGAFADVPTSTTNNTVVLGNSSITDLRCQDTTITAVSDARDKTDIQDIPVGLNFINEIRPVNFEWNMRDEGQVGNRQAGFIAQEVLAVEEKYDTRNWLKAVNTDNPDQLALAPARLLPVMVKAIQELSEQIESLNLRISQLESV
jgi:hypothetical protein